MDQTIQPAPVAHTRSRRAFLKGTLGTSAVLLVAACTPAAPAAPTSAPAKPTTAAAKPTTVPTTAAAKPAASPAASPAAAKPAVSPVASPAARVAASPSPAAKSAAGAFNQAEWDQLVAAARQEGLIVMSGPSSDLWREGLLAFQNEYPGIEIEFNGGNSRDFWPRVLKEREVDQYLWDMRIGGPDPQVFAAQESGVLEPVRPLLMLPEVADESKWLGGWDAFYADNEKRFLPGFLANVSKAVYVNREFVPEAGLNTDTDLLKPEWKGRIVIQDPRGGAGLGFLATFLQIHGEQFVRDLLSQDLIVTSDTRQLAEWIVRGRYPIAIGLRNYDLIVFQQEGVGQSVKPIENPVAEPLSIGSGGIQLLSRAPHPNASKLYINWVLTAKAQEQLTKLVEQNSRRVDVPAGAPDELPDPQRANEYVAHQTEPLLPVREKAVALARQYLQ